MILLHSLLDHVWMSQGQTSTMAPPTAPPMAAAAAAPPPPPTTTAKTTTTEHKQRTTDANHDRDKAEPTHMGVSKNRGIPWYPQIIHFKPSILGYQYFWKHPHPALRKCNGRSLECSSTWPPKTGSPGPLPLLGTWPI